MSIDKIGSVNNYNEYNKINKTAKTTKVKSTDSVNISSEAISLVENKKIMDIINNTPDVRKDKIEAIKEKLKDPNYLNDKIVNSVAEDILQAFNI